MDAITNRYIAPAGRDAARCVAAYAAGGTRFPSGRLDRRAWCLLYTFAMRRVARLVTICLLLMAIPVKGAVATSLVMCGPEHARTTLVAAESKKIAAASVSPHEHDHASHRHASNASGGHDQVAVASDLDSLAMHGSVKCSICAACCVGGAFLVSAEVSVPAFAGTDAPFPALEVRFPGTVLAGLERPPRPLLV
jgi:hypothetical protein